MSGRIVQEVFEYAPEDLGVVPFLVLLALAEDAREATRTATHSSVDNLARKTRRAPKTVHNALTDLKNRGLITTLHKAHPGRVQHYRLTTLAEHHRHATIRRNEATT